MTTTDEATRAAWLEWRRGGIGASEIAAVCGASPWQSPLSVYLRKRGDVPDDAPPTEAMRLGLRLEHAIADEFTERTGLHVIGAQTWCVHPEYEWARCTVDGFAAESPSSTRADALGVVESKSAGMLADYDPLPEHVALQVQWQLFVTELDHAWVAVLGGGYGGLGFRVLPVERDQTRIDALRAEGSRFWYAVEAGVPPETTTYAPGDRDDLAAAYPEPEPGTSVELGDRGAEVLAELRALKDVAKATAEKIAVAENTIKAALGDTEAGTVDGAQVVTWKAVQTTRVDTTRLKASAPDIAAEYSITTTSRRFLLR